MGTELILIPALRGQSRNSSFDTFSKFFLRCYSIDVTDAYTASIFYIQLQDLTFPLGLFVFPGYKKIPPYISVLCTSATIEPM